MDTFYQQVRDLLLARKKRAILNPSLKPSAVLLLLYSQANEPHLLLTKRTSLVDDHKGEISFPGGAFHHGEDVDLLGTALRETSEEVGVISEHVVLLGELDDMPTRSDYLISPYVGALTRAQAFVPQPSEVAEVLEIPLKVLMDRKTLRSEPRQYAGRQVSGFYYLYEENVIWGATARILQQFLSVLPPASRNASRPAVVP